MQLSVKDVADNANMIINGYAYTKDGDYIRVLNLNCLNNAAVIYKDEIVETNMDDIEIQIVLDYYEFKVCGYYLYYTASCVIEAMHVHASDRKLTEAGSAKFFVKSDGDTTIQKQGQLNEREVREIRKFIKKNYKEMYLKWQQLSNTGYYGEWILMLSSGIF